MKITGSIVLFLALGSVAGAAPGGSGRLSGLYLQVQPVDAGSSQRLYYYFWPDGRVFAGMPPEGTTPEALARLPQVDAKHLGHYSVSGGTITVEYPAKPEALHATFRNFDGVNFEMNGYTTVRVGAFGAGELLNGAYSGTNLGDVRWTTQKYTFNHDGTYSLGEKKISGPGPASTNVSGTYRLSGNTLDLTSAGNTSHLTIYPYVVSAKALCINGTVYSPE